MTVLARLLIAEMSKLPDTDPSGYRFYGLQLGYLAPLWESARLLLLPMKAQELLQRYAAGERDFNTTDF